MTMHIHYDHQCPQCGTEYIPYGEDVPCPKCGLVERKRHDVVSQIAYSALVNLSDQGGYVPGGWWTGTVGDNFAYFMFQVLDLHRESKGVPFSDSASSYFGDIDFGDKEFMRPYLIRLSERVFQKINELIADGYEVRIDQRRLAARIHGKIDQERRSLPGSAAKQRLRESRSKSAVQQPDGTWLVYVLDDGRQLLYRNEDASSILVGLNAGRTAFVNVAELVRHLDCETHE